VNFLRTVSMAVLQRKGGDASVVDQSCSRSSEGEKGESSASIVFFVFSPPIDNSDPDEGKLTDDRVVNLAPILDHL